MLILFLFFIPLAICQEDRPCRPMKFDHDSTCCVCDETHCDFTHPTLPKNGEFLTLTSNKAGLRFLKKFGRIGDLKATDDNCGTTKLDLDRRRLILEVNRSNIYQNIIGFGAAFTDAAGYNAECLSDDVKDALVRSLYTEGGLSYNMGRVPIGGTDFSLRGYTYDDNNEDDMELAHFALQEEDFNYKIPYIKRAKELAKDELLLTATVWSPPLFMKNVHSFVGRSHLKKNYYGSYAKYYTRFLEEYKKEGIEFWSVTPGNEITDGQYGDMTEVNDMGWMADNMAEFIADYFGPEIRNSEFNKTKILILDDNRHALFFFLDALMGYEKVVSYMDGMALHAYFDMSINADPIDQYVANYADKLLAHTEYCEGVNEEKSKRIKKGAWLRAENYAQLIIQNLIHHSSTFLDWNFALNMTGGPTYTDNIIDGTILVDGEENRFYKQPSYYAMGHFSKYMDRDSTRIQVTESTRSELPFVAVMRPDGLIVLVINNAYDHAVYTTVSEDHVGQIDLVLTPKSITTLIY